MKKVKFINFIALAVISISLVFTTGCEKEDEGITASIIGSWTVTETSMDMTIDGVPWLNYMVNELGMTSETAELDWAEMQAETDMEGTVEFKDGGIFTSAWEDDDPELGSWTLDNEKLTINVEGDDTMVFDVITLSETQLVIKLTETDSEDMDQDGTEETVEMIMQMTFIR